MDPLTLSLIASGLQAGTGIAKTAFGMSQQKRGKSALSSAYEAPTGKPSEYADMLKQARASDLAQRRIDEINRSMATSTSALQQSGSRGVIGGIGAVTEAGSRAKTGALTTQQQEIMRALERGTIGGEYERQRGVARQTREETAAQSAITAGIENISGGIGDITMGFATGADAMSDKDGKTGATQAQRDFFNEPLKFPELNLKYKKGGVQKTPGAFSHSENPLDIIQDGAKIGEMTGGEYIFNPNQAKEMKKLASSGNTDLHKFVKSLLNKPQFK